MSTDSMEALAREGIEWCRDWREGVFHPAYMGGDPWPVEMHGLVDSHETLCRGFLDLAEDRDANG